MKQGFKCKKASSKNAAGSDPSIIQQLLSQVVLSSLSFRRIVQAEAEAETSNRSRSLVPVAETRYGYRTLKKIVARCSFKFVSNRTD
jgi:hypothetical protein